MLRAFRESIRKFGDSWMSADEVRFRVRLCDRRWCCCLWRKWVIVINRYRYYGIVSLSRLRSVTQKADVRDSTIQRVDSNMCELSPRRYLRRRVYIPRREVDVLIRRSGEGYKHKIFTDSAN